jgi:hypothetical protein
MDAKLLLRKEGLARPQGETEFQSSVEVLSVLRRVAEK